MPERWQLGTPPMRDLSSEFVEVTDGSLIATARYQVAAASDSDPRLGAAWIDESGQLLSWRPTHWRMAVRPKPPEPDPSADEVLI